MSSSWRILAASRTVNLFPPPVSCENQETITGPASWNAKHGPTARALGSGVFMNYLPMNDLGALEISPKILQFGIFLPGVDPGEGYAVSVKIIHETDQYLQAAQPAVVPQAH